ncbi:RDD family protein [Streptomyces sp. NPDC001941]|uniref:RDD family protein n=1 Tax=Streptomyces sp. NPDC001941 TaxID=3154659 RepID=UPI00332D34C6
MSNDQPTPGQPPEEDPFLKKPQDPTPPSAGSPQQPPQNPYGGATPPPQDPYGGSAPPPPSYGSPYDNAPPPPPYGGGGPGGGAYGGADPLAGMPPLAESGKRILARIIDWVIIAIPLAVIGIPFKVYDRVTDDNGDITDALTSSSGGQWIWQLISIVAYIAYDTVMTSKNGQTVGKKLMGLRTAMLNDGSTPPTNAALIRAVVLWLPALICCACLWPLLLLILILVDKPYKQGLHDKAAKTVVVSAPR